MQIQWVPTENLIPYEQNSRKHSDAQISRIANAILKYEWTQPIVVDEKMMVLAGHGRLLAAKKIQAEQVPCYVVKDLSEADKRAYRILDNKLAADSDWDMDSLKLELEHLKEIDYDMDSMGLADWDGTDVEFGEEDVGPAEEDDFEAKAPLKVDVKRGDVIGLGDHTVKCADATKWEDIKQVMELHAPFMMVTDPPYGVDYEPEWRGEMDKGVRATGKVTNDEQVDWSAAYMLFKGDVIYCWHAGRHAAHVARNLEQQGFEIRTQIIWAKQHFAISRGNYHWQHEPCWYAVRKGKKSNWHGDRTQSTLWQIANRNPSGGQKDDADTIHSTQKPIECMARPIRNHESECIYDPFLGSGTTLIACEMLGRKCLGIEIEPAYVQLTIDRYRNYCTSQNKVFQCTINGKDYP